MISLCRLEGSESDSRFCTNEEMCFGRNHWHVQFLSHLLNSGNIQEAQDGMKYLFRPIDFRYAENWAAKCSYVPRPEKAHLRHAIRRTEKDGNLWFCVTMTERIKSGNTEV